VKTDSIFYRIFQYHPASFLNYSIYREQLLRVMPGAELTRDYLPGMLATLQKYINQEIDKKEQEKLESSRQFIESLGKKEKPFVSPYY
jgi:hypothetical protein